MATVDWIALAVIVLSAFGGWRRGLIGERSFARRARRRGLRGSRLAPHLLSGGSSSRWTPFPSLVGALAGATLLHSLASFAGSFLRGGLKLTPLRLLDSAGGVFFGAATGLVLVWVLGATALLLPGQTSLRREAQRSQILQNLNAHVPPRRLLHLLAASIRSRRSRGRRRRSSRPRPRSQAIPRCGARRAPSCASSAPRAASASRAAAGSLAARGRRTAAHVVAGEHDTHVQLPGSNALLRADVVAFDATNDLAILRVRNAGAQTPLRVRSEPESGRAVAIVGYPEDGPLTRDAGPHRRHGDRSDARRVRARAGVTLDHGRRGPRAARRLRRAGCRLRRLRADDALRGAHRRARAATACRSELVVRAAQSAQGPVSTGDCAVG